MCAGKSLLHKRREAVQSGAMRNDHRAESDFSPKVLGLFDKWVLATRTMRIRIVLACCTSITGTALTISESAIFYSHTQSAAWKN
jgi:hypothetical protein